MNEKWYKLDNAAKIFPPSMNRYDTKVFRFSVSLKETVDINTLKKATDLTLKDYPVFKSILKKGFFWYYLEESDLTPVIEEDKLRPCSLIEEEGLLFRITYYKKRINLEVCHALTDGTGTLIFLKALTANYLEILYKVNSYDEIDLSSGKEKSADSFNKYKGKTKTKIIKNTKVAHRIKETKYPENNLKVIEGKMPVDQLLRLAKSENTSLTIYLTSVLIESIGKTMSLKERRKPIVITVPVNLRKYYPSHTVRNFFNTVNISYYYKEEPLNKIIESVKKQFAENLTKENIDSKMNSMSKLEDIFILRLIPVFIKDIILNIALKITDRYQTMTLSNVGIIDMPKGYQKYIDYFDVFINTTSIQLCMCSYLNDLLATFTTMYMDSDIEMNFFRELSNKGIDVTINTNKIGDEE